MKVPYPIEKIVEKKVPHPFPVIKEVKVPVFIQSPQKLHQQQQQNQNHQQQNHQSQISHHQHQINHHQHQINHPQQPQQHKSQQHGQNDFFGNQLSNFFGDSFFAGSKKQHNLHRPKPQPQKANEDFLTPPTTQEEDAYRRNLKVSKQTKPKATISQINHHSNEIHPNNIQSKLPNNLQSPQPPSGFQLQKEQQNQQQHAQNKPSADPYRFDSEPLFSPHTPLPNIEHVSEASNHYETYSQHPHFQYAQTQPQYYQQDLQQQQQDLQQAAINQQFYYQQQNAQQAQQQQQSQEPQYQIQYPQYVQYQQQAQQQQTQQAQQHQQQQLSNNDFQPSYGVNQQ